VAVVLGGIFPGDCSPDTTCNIDALSRACCLCNSCLSSD